MIITVFYRKMKVEWILFKFYEPTFSEVIKKILSNTKKTKILSYGNLLCNSKKDMEIINNILMDEYHKKQREIDDLPNLFEESIKYILSL